jgi:hypothetical protein
MKNFSKIVFLFLANNLAFGQLPAFQKPNYEAIKTEISDKNSPFFYEKLEKRLVQKDSTLSSDDFKHLYFGYVFQKKYNAFWASPNSKALEVYYKKPKIEVSDCDKLIELLNASIADFPFDLRSMTFLAYAHHLKDDKQNEKKINFVMQRIFETILTSGDGKTCETGFHVINVSHEYAILNVFQMEHTTQSLSGNCDVMDFEKGKYKIETLFFNIEKMLENERKILEGK